MLQQPIFGKPTDTSKGRDEWGVGQQREHWRWHRSGTAARKLASSGGSSTFPPTSTPVCPLLWEDEIQVLLAQSSGRIPLSVDALAPGKCFVFLCLQVRDISTCLNYKVILILSPLSFSPWWIGWLHPLLLYLQILFATTCQSSGIKTKPVNKRQQPARSSPLTLLILARYFAALRSLPRLKDGNKEKKLGCRCDYLEVFLFSSTAFSFSSCLISIWNHKTWETSES